MANVNRPSGLSPVEDLLSGAYDGQGRVYYIRQGDTSAYAIGDPVATDSGNADANGVQAVKLATAGDGNVIRGVIVSMGGPVEGGLYGDPTNLNTTIIPATKLTGYYVLVIDDPFVVFEVQAFGNGYTAADIGKNANLKSGTNSGFCSGWTLDDTAASSTASTRQVKLVGIARRPDNALGSSYCKFLVHINNHELKAGVAGV